MLKMLGPEVKALASKTVDIKAMVIAVIGIIIRPMICMPISSRGI